MATEVRTATPERVVLAAPLARNLNHRATAFGGSVAAQAILAGWALVHVRLEDEGIRARTVVQKSTVSYLEPIREDFEARAGAPDPRSWRRFRRSLDRWRRGRIRIDVEVWSGALLVARLAADYVALLGADD
jgi:thioesterase domain-containing protein